MLVLHIRKMSEIQKRGPQTGRRLEDSLKRQEEEVNKWCQGRGGSREQSTEPGNAAVKRKSGT